MQRLTEKTKDCFGYRLKDGSDSEVGFFKNYDAFYSHMMMVKALGEYEDLEEQGLLLRLPCKVGDVVYIVDYKYECDCNYDCVEFDIYKCEANIRCEHEYKIYKVIATKFQKQMVPLFGKTVFLTKEEAEAKLKEMEV